MYSTLKRHPAIFGAIFFFLVYGLPLGIVGVWGNFSDDKIPAWLAKRGYPSVIKFLIAWAVIALLCSLLFYVIVAFLMPSERPIVRLAYEIDDLSEHENWRLDDVQSITVINDGPGTVFGVKLSDIDLRDGTLASFNEIQSIGQGEQSYIEPEIVRSETRVPVFAPADLAHALHDSVSGQTAAAYEDKRTTIGYPVSVRYKNATQETFQTDHKINAYDPPIFLRVATEFISIKRVWFPSRGK